MDTRSLSESLNFVMNRTLKNRCFPVFKNRTHCFPWMPQSLQGARDACVVLCMVAFLHIAVLNYLT